MLFLLPQELSERQVIAASLPRWFLLQELGCSWTEALGTLLRRFRLVIFLTAHPQKLSMKELCHVCIPFPLPTPTEKKAPEYPEYPGEYRAEREGTWTPEYPHGRPPARLLAMAVWGQSDCLWKCWGLGTLPTDTSSD